MYKYNATIKERKDVEPHSGQYAVYDVTCPFCGYTCEIHAVSRTAIESLYPKCNVCKKKFIGEVNVTD